MKRLPSRRFAFDRTDAVVVAALLAVGFSYFIGSGLDWSQVEAAMPEPTVPAAQTVGPAETVLASAVSSVMPQAAPALPPAGSGPALEAPDPAWNELVRRLAAQAISFDGRVAVYIKDLQKGRVWAYHADDLFPSASLIKVPIMFSVFNKIAIGDLSLQTRLKLEKRHRTGGSGSLKWYRDGSQFTVRQLLEKMIDESDNTATRMLIDEVGIAYLQQQFAKMGLVYTEIYPEGLSLKNTGVTYENYTTAREMAGLLDKVYRGDAVDRYSSQLMVDILKRLKAHSRLAKFLPSGWEIAHKTGLLRRACHDSSIIFSPKGDYIMVVLTGQNRDYTTAKDFISKLGQLTYRYYENDPSFYVRASEYRLAQRNRNAHDVD